LTNLVGTDSYVFPYLNPRSAGHLLLAVRCYKSHFLISWQTCNNESVLSRSALVETRKKQQFSLIKHRMVAFLKNINQKYLILYVIQFNAVIHQINSSQPGTPALIYTAELLWMLRNISSLVNVRWHLGIPFNDTSNFRLAIAEQGQAILGDYLIGLQVGNEPDLYVDHGHRESVRFHPCISDCRYTNPKIFHPAVRAL